MPARSPLARELILSASVATTFAAVLVWLGPPGGDLAAHIYQRAVFVQHGFAFWNNFWYSGRYSFVTYSLLYYPLAALLGIRLLAVATIATATIAFVLLLWRQWGPRTRWSSRTFAVVWAGFALTAAFPFALGAAIALLAGQAAQARRPGRFVVLALLTLCASPLALLFLTVVLVGIAISRRRESLLLISLIVALGAVWTAEVVIYRLFPGSGRYPFSLQELAAAVAFCLVGIALTWRVEGAREIRWFFPIYGFACVGAYLIPSQIGENVVRLRFVAAPIALLVLALRDWRPRPVAFATLALALSWNTSPLAASFEVGRSEPTARATYWAPAIRFLHAHLTPAYRVEVVDTVGHWAANYLPQAGVPIARGWFRQDDFPQNELLYRPIGARAYLAWLHRLAVRYVLLTDAPPDYSARAEAALVAGPRSPLQPIFRTRHLTIYSVPQPRPLISGRAPSRVLVYSQSRVVFSVDAPGHYRLAVRYSPYLRSSIGCVRPSHDGMTTLDLPAAGVVSVEFQLNAEAAFNALAGTGTTACRSNPSSKPAGRSLP